MAPAELPSIMQIDWRCWGLISHAKARFCSEFTLPGSTSWCSSWCTWASVASQRTPPRNNNAQAGTGANVATASRWLTRCKVSQQAAPLPSSPIKAKGKRQEPTT